MRAAVGLKQEEVSLGSNQRGEGRQRGKSEGAGPGQGVKQGRRKFNQGSSVHLGTKCVWQQHLWLLKGLILYTTAHLALQYTCSHTLMVWVLS